MAPAQEKRPDDELSPLFGFLFDVLRYNEIILDPSCCISIGNVKHIDLGKVNHA